MMHVHDRYEARLRHVPSSFTLSTVVFDYFRYLCPKCRRYEIQDIPFKAAGHRMTTQLEQFTKGLLEKGFTNKEVTIITGLGRNTVKDIDLARLKEKYTVDGKHLKKPEKQAMCYDKYAEHRKQLKVMFEANRHCYRYRRLHELFRQAGTTLSEKVVRRLMKEEGLSVYRPRKRKSSSYVGEISPEVPNIINRNFHASKPNEKWLTEITEFAIKNDKVYLSPIIDCFDGLVVSRTIGTSPSAELVNTMLDNAISTLAED